jgi:hypothetical protein
VMTLQVPLKKQLNALKLLDALLIFELMTRENYETCIKSSLILFQNDECKNIFMMRKHVFSFVKFYTLRNQKTNYHFRNQHIKSIIYNM